MRSEESINRGFAREVGGSSNETLQVQVTLRNRRIDLVLGLKHSDLSEVVINE